MRILSGRSSATCETTRPLLLWPTEWMIERLTRLYADGYLVHPWTRGCEFLAQDRKAEGVEGGDGKTLGIRVLEQVGHTRFHFARRLVGEGDGGEARRRNAAFLDKPGDLARDHRGLAAARASQHQQRSVDVAHGFFLAGVELGHGSRWMAMGRYCSGQGRAAKA